MGSRSKQTLKSGSSDQLIGKWEESRIYRERQAKNAQRLREFCAERIDGENDSI